MSDCTVDISYQDVDVYELTYVDVEESTIILNEIFMYPPEEGEVVKTHQAGQRVEAYRVVMLDSSGFLQHCDCTNKEHIGKALGLSLNAGNTGSAISVKYLGVVNTGVSDFTVGEDYFLGADGNLVLETPHNAEFQHKIGVATSTRNIYVNISGYIEEDEFNESKVLAGEDLSAHLAVVYDASGNLVHADSSNIDHADKVAGVSTTSATSGNEITFKEEGEVEFASWNWNLSKEIFFTAQGVLTQVVPTTGFFCSVGYPINSTTIYVRIDTNNIIL